MLDAIIGNNASITMIEDDVPFDLVEIVRSLGDAGRRLSEIDASEGAAGNLSVCLVGSVTPHPALTRAETVTLPLAVPKLAGATLVVSGSGSRLRDIHENPVACLGCLEVQAGGQTAILRSAEQRGFARLTSEFNSHLGVHDDHVSRHGHKYHALVHAQPRRLTYLSHVTEYQSESYLNRQLLRWQPEAILSFPEGLGVVPFLVPSSTALMDANIAALRNHRVAIWCKHGLMTRSSRSIMAAVDMVEYAETAAVYECLDWSLGRRAQGLSDSEIRAVAEAYSVEQGLY